MRSTNSNGSMDGASSGGDQLPPQQQSSAQAANLQPPPTASLFAPEGIQRYLLMNSDAKGMQELNQSISFLQQQQQQQEGRSAGMPFSTMLSGGNCRRDNHEDNPPKPAKSNNTTECVRVPSSEHVAEIVGRQGCKIKALRAKTNTYIKTPVRGEEPVFVVTGRRDDVSNAVKEILSAAEHFTAIRAQRRNSSVSSSSNGNGASQGPPSPNAPGQVSCKVKVPYNFVGLVVGPKGQTVKSIQQKTSTYIVTPNRAKSPVFDVTGTPEEVRRAAEQIEGHIRERGKVPVIFQRNGIYDYEVVIDQEELNRRGGVAGSGAVGASVGVVGGADGGLYNFRHNSRREKESSFQRGANGDLPASSPFVPPTYDSWYNSVGGGNLTTDGEHAANGDTFDDNREYFTFDFPNSVYLKDTISALANSSTCSQNFFMNGSASQQRRAVKSDSLALDELGPYGMEPQEYRNGSASNGTHHSDPEVFHLGSDALLSHDRAFRQRMLSEGARMSPPRSEWNGTSSRDDSPFPLREPRLPAAAPHKAAANGVQQNFGMRDLFNNYHSFELMNFGNGSPSSLSNGYSNGSTSSLANGFANGSPGGLSNGYSNGSTSSMSSNGFSTGLNGMSTPSLPDGLSNGLSSGLENGFHNYRSAGGFGSPFNLPEIDTLSQLARLNISGSGSTELPSSSVPMPSTSTLCSSSSAPARPITSTYYSSSTAREADLSSCQSSESSPRAGAGNMEGRSSKGGSPLGDLGRSSSEGGGEFACDVCGSHDEAMGNVLGLSYACSSCANSHAKSPLRSLTPIDF